MNNVFKKYKGEIPRLKIEFDEDVYSVSFSDETTDSTYYFFDIKFEYHDKAPYNKFIHINFHFSKPGNVVFGSRRKSSINCYYKDELKRLFEEKPILKELALDFLEASINFFIDVNNLKLKMIVNDTKYQFRDNDMSKYILELFEEKHNLTKAE